MDVECAGGSAVFLCRPRKVDLRAVATLDGILDDERSFASTRSFPIGTSFDQLFMIPCLGFAALFVAWLALALATDIGRRAGFGIIGSLLATLMLGALWQPDYVQWLWMAGAVRAVPTVWTWIALLNGFALVSGRGRSKVVLSTAIALGVVGFILHAFGAILFLWAATMSI